MTNNFFYNVNNLFYDEKINFLKKKKKKNFRKRPTLDLKSRIKSLNVEIRNYFFLNEATKYQKAN